MAPRKKDDAVEVGRKAAVPFSEEVWDEILDHLTDGRTLRDIEALAGMPGKNSIMRWLRERPELRERYDDARCHASDDFEAEIIAKAREAGARPDINPSAAKLHIETMRWVLERRDPTRYGAKQSLEHSGPGGVALSPPTLVIATYEKPNDGDAD